MAIHLIRRESALPRDALSKVCLSWPSGSWEEHLQIFWIEICYFGIISTWRKAWTFIWINMNLLYARMPCTMFGRNWPSVLEKKIFNKILHFRYYLPLEKDVTIHLNKLESLPSKDALCYVCLKLAKQFWKRICLINLNRNLLFRYYFPLEKGVALHLNKLESPSSKNLYQVWIIWAQWFYRRRILNIFNIILHFCYYLPFEKGHGLSFQ